MKFSHFTTIKCFFIKCKNTIILYFFPLQDQDEHSSSDSSEENDSISQEIPSNDKPNLKEILTNFKIFKKWYEKIPNCTQQDAFNLNNIEKVVEELLCTEICENKKID